MIRIVGLCAEMPRNAKLRNEIKMYKNVTKLTRLLLLLRSCSREISFSCCCFSDKKNHNLKNKIKFLVKILSLNF